MPIRELSCYTGKFTIRVRVMRKHDIRTYKNARSEGKLFKVDLIDAEGGEIGCTFFNELLDKWH